MGEEDRLRIAVVGGGPAGLFFAAQVKRENAAHEVTVFERCTADTTYGWGVVLPESAVNFLQETDPRTYVAMRACEVQFDGIQIRYRGELIRTAGHRYSAIGRQRFLSILQARCKEEGVSCRFEAEVRHPGELVGYDLIVAADGVNSMVRSAHPARFGPSFSIDSLKYIWLGIEGALDAMTFVIRECEYGWFQAHLYPYDRALSACVIFCSEPDWRRAGFDTATEQDTLTRCQHIFEPDLEGYRLLSNNSRWSSFTTVATDRWHGGDVVLLGDSAHTLHPTIGSGTKLAIEDGWALAKALSANHDRGIALQRYEMGRKPVVGRFQAAALASRAFFENLERRVHLDPLPFALQLLTRSGRLDYQELRRRDPLFVDRLERTVRARPVPAERHRPN